MPFYVVAGELDDAQAHRERPRPRSLSPPRLRLHGGRVPGPRSRGFLRRDPADVRLDGPFPPQFLSPRVRLRDDAAVGQFLLVGRDARAAAAVDGRSGPTGPRPPACSRAGEGENHRRQRRDHPDRHRSKEVTVWLSPKMLDFKQRVTVTVKTADALMARSRWSPATCGRFSKASMATACTRFRRGLGLDRPPTANSPCDRWQRSQRLSVAPKTRSRHAPNSVQGEEGRSAVWPSSPLDLLLPHGIISLFEANETFYQSLLAINH